MACGSCGGGNRGAQRARMTAPQEAPSAGDFLVTYPNGTVEVFRQLPGRPSPRRAAARAALASGGTYEQVKPAGTRPDSRPAPADPKPVAPPAPSAAETAPEAPVAPEASGATGKEPAAVSGDQGAPQPGKGGKGVAVKAGVEVDASGLVNTVTDTVGGVADAVGGVLGSGSKASRSRKKK